MSFFKLSTLVCVSSLLKIATSSPALPAIQLINPRDPYQGGWPLALTGTNSGSCPAEASVQCASTNVNPECCPSGQTCFWGAAQFTNYCCPISADCNTAVLNFPRCANTSWNMFEDGASSFFCCEAGTLGVYPASGKSGGVCEPSDQVIPTSLLATMVSQIGAPTPTPTSSVGAVNATTTAGGPAETNPSLLPSSTSDGDGGASTSGSNGTAGWSKPVKIGAGVAVGVAFVAIIAIGSICNRRRRNNLGYGYGGHTGEFDEYGNRVPGYRTGYEPYTRMDRPTENNVTVNVVQGDMQH